MSYSQATAADVQAAFPKFAAVDDAVIEFWLTEARRRVDDSWTEDDRAMGEMLMACHLMTLEGVGTGTEAQLAAEGLAGLTSVKSGQFAFTKDGAANGAAQAGSLRSTTYGTRWAEIAQINRGGARVTATGAIPQSSLYPEV